MKKTVITLQICIVLIIASFSSIAGASIQEKTNSDQEESLQTTQVTMNIHTLSGREKRTIDIPISFLNNPSEPLSFEEIISYLSEEDQTYVKQLMERDIQKLTTLFSQRNRPQNILLNKENNLFKKLITPVDEYFVNYLCQVKGFGLLFLFPPFLPITPVLWAALLIINTNGTMGEINKAVEQAIMIPFVGISVWAVQTYFFAGFAGVAIGMNDSEDD